MSRVGQPAMTDPITCPECGGARGERVGELFLACQFCHGRGLVGGDFEPAEQAEAVPPVKPPAWRHRTWQDPEVARGIKCRHCMDAREVTHLDERAGRMLVAPCPVCVPVA